LRIRCATPKFRALEAHPDPLAKLLQLELILLIVDLHLDAAG
jgi:hypothetical protein